MPSATTIPDECVVVVLKVADDILLTYDPQTNTLWLLVVRLTVTCPHTSAVIDALFLLRQQSGIRVFARNLRPYAVTSYRLDNNGFYALVTIFSAHFPATDAERFVSPIERLAYTHHVFVKSNFGAVFTAHNFQRPPLTFLLDFDYFEYVVVIQSRFYVNKRWISTPTTQFAQESWDLVRPCFRNT
jgi:hypothetical protein